MQWRRLTTGLGSAVSLVVIPAAGTYGMLRDADSLTPLTAGMYLAMMGLPGARVLDLKRRAAEVAEDDESDG